ncbi:MAG: tyrosine--tRNA ligase [Nitrospira sp.]|nr:tyrosine--tRNA ligase [Nitrospira sp.]
MSTQPVFKPVDEQLRTILRGAVEVIQKNELEEKLRWSSEKKCPLRVKAGFDPTSPHLHLGHTVLLQKLKTFQDLGHQVIFLVGDFTGMIGDPSGMSETRRPLTREQVDKNAQTYQQQVFKILDPKKTIIRKNSEWMCQKTAEDLIHLAGQYTLARMLERDDFQKRYKEQRPISLHEFLYPLIQGYDSVMLEADVELGGTDQKFNLLVGRELQKLVDKDLRSRSAGKLPQVVITLPLLEGTDAKRDEKGVLVGRKMSKSYGNAIGLDELPSEIFGKIMSISDELMWRYYELLTDHELEEAKKLHPKEAKLRLGENLVTRFYDRNEAQTARDQFEQRHRPRHPAIDASYDTTQSPLPLIHRPLLDILYEEKLISSKSEGRRLIHQGAVEVNGQKISDPNHQVSGKLQVRVGKHRFTEVQVVKGPKKS